MANDLKEIRYAASMCCVSDFFVKKNTDRKEEDLSCKDCVNAIRLLAKELDNLPNKEQADNCWGFVTNGKEGIKITDLVAIEDKWDNHVAYYHYAKQKYDFIATEKFREWYIANGGNIYEMEAKLGLYRFVILQVLEYRHKIPKPLRLAVLELRDRDNVSWEELKTTIDKYLKKNNKGENTLNGN